MRRLATVILSLFMLVGCSGIKVSKSMLRMMLSASNIVNTDSTFADSCEHRVGVPYVQDGAPDQVVDIYYAPSEIRRNAVLIDIHGGFYVAGKRQNNRKFASVFLKEGYDVVLLEYRVNDGNTDVSHELSDCAAALDYLAANADALGLNRNSMFLTGDSAGGHISLYMAEGACDKDVPIRPELFSPRGVMLNCPAYDFASFSNSKTFTKSALAWFIGPRYEDREWLESISPRTFIGSYTGPLFVSTCTYDFIRGEALKIKADCDSLGRGIEFLDIESDNKKVGHVHNVVNLALPESITVNNRMLEFMGSLE